MTIEQAGKLLGNRATWELKAMHKALTSLGGFFNNEEDNQRLEAVKVLLRKEKNG